jgi:hypothetical protein
MEEKDPIVKDSIGYLLHTILRKKHVDDNASFAHAPVDSSASPEEGVHLIRAFIRIKQPELRAAIIKFTTQMADEGALKSNSKTRP